MEKIESVEITSELSQSYLDYAMSVIVARALPDIRDGLKPVHRRILYAMHDMGLGPGGNYSKSAKVVGEVLGKYHPHGDTSVYDAMVRMAQEFSMRYPLVDGQGNFGSIDGDPPAAMRYTEAKLAKISTEMLTDIEKETVEMMDNFDTTLKEPVYLPALLPNLLLMGSEGIAVGMATKIPPHNLTEVVDAIITTVKAGRPIISSEEEKEEETEFVIKKISLVASGKETGLTEADIKVAKISFESEVTIEELMKTLPGPDFPTGGVIYGAKGLIDVYATGRGKISVRGIAEIKEGKRGRTMIEINELPYQVNKALLVSQIAELVKNKRLNGIATIRDESDKAGLSVVIELKRDARPKSILNNLFKHTKLQTSFPANFVALVNGTPHTVNLKQILVEYVKHRQQVITRRTIFELTMAKKRAHILEGLKIALDNLDAVIKTIRQSKTQEDAKNNLMKKYQLTEIQATAILDMMLRRLAALEREKIEKEYEEKLKLIEQLTAILKNPKSVLEIIIKELTKLKEGYADKRRTKIYQQNIGEFSEEDLIAKEDVLITVTKTGYIKRLPRGTFKAQRRGGKGVVGMSTKEEDEIEHMLSASTHDTILFFTNMGRVFGSRVWEIPETTRQSKGHALVNIINLEQGELVMSIVTMTGNGAKYLLMATKKGIIKKTALRQFENLRSNGLIAIRLEKGDSLEEVCTTDGNDQVMLLSENGKVIRFPEKNVRPMGRATKGVRGINLGAGDKLIGMEVFPEKERIPKDKRKKHFRDILTISEKGIGKRTAIRLVPVQNRAGKGVKAAVINDRTGKLAGAKMVTQEVEQIVITSTNGQVIKLPIRNIPEMGRATQGVILMRFARRGDRVAAVARLEKR